MLYEDSRPWLFSLPALAVVVLYGSIVGRAAWNQKSTEDAYRSRARQAMEDGDYDRAKVHYSRLVADEKNTDSEDKYNWAQIVALSGDTQSATKLIESLAPDVSGGYAPAHRFKAIQLALLLEAHSKGESNGPVDVDVTLKLLKHHLSRSGTEEPQELADLWTAYHLAAGEKKEAVGTLMEAAQWEPTRWLQAARLSREIGDVESRSLALKRAAAYYAEILAERPRDVTARITLAGIDLDLERWDQAEGLLKDGLKLSGMPEPDVANLRRAMSDFYLLRLASIPDADGKGFAEVNRRLMVAIEADPTNPMAYQRMVELYQITGDEARRGVLREQLERQIAAGQSIPFAHFALGSVLWLEGKHDDAVWHTKKALELNPELTDVANNLAWLLADKYPDQLARAHELVEMALAKKPDDPRYRDTKGMILFKQERWDEALVEYESILPLTGGDRRKQLHGRLAEIYGKLGKASLAKVHEEAAVGSRQ